MATPNTQQQTLTIKDFTPGIIKFGRGNYGITYPPGAPHGSASSAVRCYAEPGVGLCPFPTYTSTVSGAITNSVNGSWLIRCGIRSMGLLLAMNTETLVQTHMYYDGTNTSFDLNTFTASGTALSALTNRVHVTQAGNQTRQTPNLVTYFETVDGVVVGCMRPLNNTATLQTVSWWTGSAAFTSGISVPVQFFDLVKLFVQSSRVVGCGIEQFAAGNSFTDFFITDPPQQPVSGGGLTFTHAKFEPSQLLGIGSWGSIDAGEAFIIGQNGGAVYITGDIFAPTSVVKLPAVVSTGGIIGPSAVTSSGYVYLTEQGAYSWNGGNTSQKISNQIPDDVLYRTAGFTFNPLPSQRPVLTHHDTWGDWVLFCNNWMYSTITNSWWQVEDPAVAQMNLHCQSVMSNRFFFSSQDFVQNTSGGLQTIQLLMYAWDRNKPSSSYTWISNPIATQPGFLTTLSQVEIVASNPSSTSCTIQVTPEVPAGQTPIAGNNAQSVTFTIPPTTSAMRQSATLGYTDWNIQIGLNAANSNTNNQAPIIHEVSVVYVNENTSGVGI